MSRHMESCLPPVAHIVADLDEIEADEAMRMILSDPARSATATLTGGRKGGWGTGWHRTTAGVLSVSP